MNVDLTELSRALSLAIASTQAKGAAEQTAMAQAMVASLRTLVHFDHCVAFAYRGNSPPSNVFDTFDTKQRHVYVTLYQQGPYLLDPFYQSASERKRGLWRMQEVAPDRFYSSDYFRNYYVQTGLAEEVGFFVGLDSETTIVVSLMRLKQSRAFSSREVLLLRAIEPIVTALIQRSWSNMGDILDVGVYKNPGAEARLSNQRPTHDVEWMALKLTRREANIVELVLQGHSSDAISARLGISPGTVKVHRRNIYKKLGINSQAELLATFIQHVRS